MTKSLLLFLVLKIPGTFTNGNGCPAFVDRWQRERALLHLLFLNWLQLTIILMSKWLIWRWHILTPFKYNNWENTFYPNKTILFNIDYNRLYFNKTINIYSDIVEAEGVNRQSYVSIPSAAPALQSSKIALFFSCSNLIFNTIFKGYFPCTVITKCWLHFPCCTIHPWACLSPNSLYPPLPHRCISMSPSLSPHW